MNVPSAIKIANANNGSVRGTHTTGHSAGGIASILKRDFSAFRTYGTYCKRDAIMDMNTNNGIDNLDDNIMDPQLCATFACDIYKHLRASKKINVCLGSHMSFQ